MPNKKKSIITTMPSKYHRVFVHICNPRAYAHIERTACTICDTDSTRDFNQKFAIMQT